MSQYKTEPEYSVEPSERMRLTEKVQDCLNRDYLQVVADLVELYQQAIKLQDMSVRNTDSIRVLVRSLRGQG